MGVQANGIAPFIVAENGFRPISSYALSAFTDLLLPANVSFFLEIGGAV